MNADNNRITQRLTDLKRGGTKALACFVTPGFPALNSTYPVLRAIEDGGADILEIGMPFSDPLADGPVIQHSSQAALANGITLNKILALIREFRRVSDIPIVLMGYLNPIFNFGIETFLREAAAAGVDGLILPELPLEDSGSVRSRIAHSGLAQIMLVAPTTPAKRIAAIDRASSGFLYCVSTTGVTGSGHRAPGTAYLDRVKRSAAINPVLVGFGIRTPGDAARTAARADGVIVGSEIIRRLSAGASVKEISRFVRTLKNGLGGIRNRT